MVYWRRPEEWAEMIYTWIVNTGQNRSIMTFFELTEGDLVQGTGG
jgi:ESCRT-II complex subunit VPS25